MQRPDLIKYLALQFLFAVLQQRTVNVAANQSDVHGCRSLSVFSYFTTVFRCGKAPVTAFAPFLLCRSALGLVVHTGYIIDGNKGLGVLAVDEVHQLLILVFVHDGNDLVVLFKVVCTNGLVHGGTAMQVVDDELPQRLLLLGNDAHPALDAVIEDEMIQHHAIEVGAMIFATISSPPEDALRLNRMLRPTLTTRI